MKKYDVLKIKLLTCLLIIFASFFYGVNNFTIFADYNNANHKNLTIQNQNNILEYKNQSNFTNLIILARFSDEDEFIDTSYDNISVKNLIDNTYSNCDYAVSNYFYSVSNGKVKMQNLYLFSNGGSISLSKPRGYYAEKDDLNPNGYNAGEENTRMYELKQDWSNAINTAFNNGEMPTSIDGNKYPISELDKNNDGKIDAITIIYKNTTQNISVSWSSPLWNYQDYCNNVSVTENGITYESANYVQLTFNYSNNEKTLIYTDENGVQFLNQSTACHEMSHIFGLKDLYRSSSVSEIYYMSIMGKHLSPVGQFMSIKERECMGWLNSSQIKSLTKEGSFTLNVITSDITNEKVLGYKLDLPQLQKTLYLEYRKFDGGENKFDTKNKNIYLSSGDKLIGTTLKSGLVCYLANSNVKIPSNLGTTGSNWNFVALGGTYSTKSDCAVALYESLDITDTLYVEVTNVTDTELTFSIYGDELKNLQPSCTHNNMILHSRVEATCQTTGNIEYYYCSTCQKYFTDFNGENEISISQTIIDKVNHTYAVIKGTPATCTNNGLSDGVICSVCNEILTEQTLIPKTGHKLKVISGTPATCTNDGLTDGQICEICNNIISSQQKINKLGHIPSDWIINQEATTEHAGEKHKECTRCHTILETIPIDKLSKPDQDNETNKDNKPFNYTPLIIALTVLTAVSIATIIIIILHKSKNKHKKRHIIINSSNKTNK